MGIRRKSLPPAALADLLAAAPPPPGAPEAAFQRDVVDYARGRGWLCYHTRDSRGSDPGWPDLVLCRPPRLLVAELKSARGRQRAAQRAWRDALTAAGVAYRVWRSADWPRIVEELR